MQNLKKMIVRYLIRIVLVIVLVILFVASGVQALNAQRTAQDSAASMLYQLEQLLEDNQKELDEISEEYTKTCLRNAEAIAYIIQYHPSAAESMEELKKIAAFMEVDEIHIIDKSGRIVMGTHPEYFGLTFNSGEQISFFKPMLQDKSLRLCQEITPNTGAGKMMQYSALWSENQEFILQVGMEPVNVMRVTEKNELAYILSMLRVNVGVDFYAIDIESGEIKGSTDQSVVGKNMTDVGFDPYDVKMRGESFHTKINGVNSYCVFHKMDSYYIGRSVSNDVLYERIPASIAGLAVCLIIIAIILVFFVTKYMNRYVIASIHGVNDKLRSITEGNLDENVDVRISLEFAELSGHINEMIKSLLSSTDKISYILNKTNMHVGVYEYNENMKKVRFTDYVPKLLALDVDKTRQFMADYSLFKAYLDTLRENPVFGEERIYRLCTDEERYVKLEEVTHNNDIFGIVIDMTEEMIKLKKVETERDIDLLTGVYNRRGFENQLSELFNEPDKLGYGAMIMLDADGLKQINDQYGHEKGDVYLQKIASTIKNFGMQESVVARHGGDEFVLFVYQYDSEEEVLNTIKMLEYVQNNSTAQLEDGMIVPLSFSFGYCLLNEQKDFLGLLKQADERMYDNKRKRKQKREGVS